jgi:phytoene synthase
MSTQPVSIALRQEAIATLATHGKTFYWASFFLGKDRAAVAALLYQSCRQLDDIADDPSKNNEQSRIILNRIKNELSQTELVGCHPVSEAWRQLVQIHGIDAAAVSSLINGLIQDTDFVCFHQERDLDRYCYRVAGTVGVMMCSVLGVRAREALPFAIDLGMAMQLTNICRDVLEDASLGRRYLPVNAAISNLLEAPRDQHQEVISCIAAQLERADQFYESALTGLTYLPRGSRVAIYLAAVLYRAIGRKLRTRQCQWWQGRVIVSAREKLGITIGALPVLIRLMMAKGPPPGAKHSQALHQHLEGLPYADI